MTDIDITYDASTVVTGDVDMGPLTTATLAVVNPSGATIQSPTVTLPSVSTTIAAGTTSTVLTLTAVTGIASGTRLLVVSDGVTYACTAAVVDAVAKTASLVTGLPVTPDTGAPVYGATLTATVTAPGSAAIGGNYRLVWTYSTATTTRTITAPASVVRWPFRAPCTAEDVRDIVTQIGGGARSNAWCADVADTVTRRIRGKLEQTGRRPWLYLSAAVFADAARQGIRYELAQRGIALGGQIYEAQRELRFAAEDTLATVITSLAGYDKNADGTIDADEARPMHFTIQAVR